MRKFGPTRRAVVAGMLAAGATGQAAVGSGTPSLQALAAAKGRRFGAAVSAADLSDPRMRALLSAECDMLVCQTEMKWRHLRPNARDWRFGDADRIAAFAGRHGLGLRGHTLLWHHPDYTPEWLHRHDFGRRPIAAAETMLTDHIRMVAARYPQVASWDVVNEAVHHETGNLRDTPFARILGERTLHIAFYTARATAPGAQLVYNDYMNWGDHQEAHRRGVLRLLERFRRDSVPCDALGIQSHLKVLGGPNAGGELARRVKVWRAFLKEVTDLGYDLLVTEFDVSDEAAPGEPAVRDQLVAEVGRAFLDETLSTRRAGDVLAWGMVDPLSWLQGFTPRPDGLPQRPTLFDGDYRPKPLRAAVAAALAQAARYHRGVK